MMIVEHVRRPVFRRIDKKVKQRIEMLIDGNEQDGAVIDAEFKKNIRHILNNAVDQEYLATMVAFIPEGSKMVVVGYAQCRPTTIEIVGYDEETGEPQYEVHEGDDFSRGGGIVVAEGRASAYAEKNMKDKYFLPDELPAHVRKNFGRFMERAKRYFKDKDFIPWAVHEYEMITKQQFYAL
jgi:hypothetical protein